MDTEKQQPLVRFATGREGKQLESLLLELQLYLAGDTTDHVVLSYPDGYIVGVAMLSRWDRNRFHLEVIGIRASELKRGYGDILLGALVKDPWQYCRKENVPTPGEELAQEETLTEEKSVITTVSRGSAQGFYHRHGFEACTFGDLPPLYLDQCTDCPDKEACEPVAMIRK